MRAAPRAMVTRRFSHLTEVSNQRIRLATIAEHEIQDLSYTADFLLFAPFESFRKDRRQFRKIGRLSNDGVLLPDVCNLELNQPFLIQVLDSSHQSRSILPHVLGRLCQIQRVPRPAFLGLAEHVSDKFSPLS